MSEDGEEGRDTTNNPTKYNPDETFWGLQLKNISF